MRATTEECPVAVLVMSLQSIVGVVIQVYIIQLYIIHTLVPIQVYIIVITQVYIILNILHTTYVLLIPHLLVPGLHGWDSVCQVHQAHHEGGDHPLQQECPHLPA